MNQEPLQGLIDRAAIIETTRRFFNCVDGRDRTGLAGLLADEVTTDYTELRDGEALSQAKDERINLFELAAQRTPDYAQ